MALSTNALATREQGIPVDGMDHSRICQFHSINKTKQWIFWKLPKSNYQTFSPSLVLGCAKAGKSIGLGALANLPLPRKARRIWGWAVPRNSKQWGSMAYRTASKTHHVLPGSNGLGETGWAMMAMIIHLLLRLT